MNRQILVVLLIGWLLGVGTAVVAPQLRYQRLTINTSAPLTTSRPSGATQLRQAINDGWTVVRQDEGFFTLERPRLQLP